MSPAPVIFDLDGVLIESEERWYEARRDYADTFGLLWSEPDQVAIIGKNSFEWSRYMREVTGIPKSEQRIVADLLTVVVRRFEEESPEIAGAAGVVRELAQTHRLAVASSAPKPMIRWSLQALGLVEVIAVWVSADEVPRGKPAPDVYLEACARLGDESRQSVAVEDSAGGILAAKAAGLAVVAVPNRRFPPPDEVLSLADCTVQRLTELTSEMVQSLRPMARGVVV